MTGTSPTPTWACRFAAWPAAFDGERVSRAFAAIDRALEAIDRNASPKIVADWLAFQL